MQEKIVPLKGLQGDADVRTEEQKEFTVWKDCVLAVMRLLWTASLEECLLAGRMMERVAKRVMWIICKVPRPRFRK